MNKINKKRPTFFLPEETDPRNQKPNQTKPTSTSSTRSEATVYTKALAHDQEENAVQWNHNKRDLKH